MIQSESLTLATTPLYRVLTWDADIEAFTPQEGLSVPHEGITLAQLRQAVRELRSMGYTAHRQRGANGNYDNNDFMVSIERVNHG